MDPNANLAEQEEILRRRLHVGRTKPAGHYKRRLAELREALWAWLHRHGFEPRWSECPNAAKHYRAYGGSNVPLP